MRNRAVSAWLTSAVLCVMASELIVPSLAWSVGTAKFSKKKAAPSPPPRYQVLADELRDKGADIVNYVSEKFSKHRKQALRRYVPNLREEDGEDGEFEKVPMSTPSTAFASLELSLGFPNETPEEIDEEEIAEIAHRKTESQRRDIQARHPHIAIMWDENGKPVEACHHADVPVSNTKHKEAEAEDHIMCPTHEDEELVAHRRQRLHLARRFHQSHIRKSHTH